MIYSKVITVLDFFQSNLHIGAFLEEICGFIDIYFHNIRVYYFFYLFFSFTFLLNLF